MLSEPLEVVRHIAAAGGPQRFLCHRRSLASSVYEFPRATQDANIVAAITLQKTGELAELLSMDFYVDVAMKTDAIKLRSLFSVVKLTIRNKANVP